MTTRSRKRQDLGDTLRTAIRRNGFNAFQISRQGNIPYAAVHRFMRDRRDITLRTATKIARLVGLELRPVGEAKKGR